MRSILTTIGEVVGLVAAQVAAWVHSWEFGVVISGLCLFAVSVLVGDE